MSELKSSTSSRSKESPDPLLIWHRSHCQGVKLTMNSAADFLFNQHDSLFNTFLPLFEGIVFQMCYISRFTLLRVLAYNKQRSLHRTLSLSTTCQFEMCLQLAGAGDGGDTTVCCGHCTGCGADWCRPADPPQVAALSCRSCTPVLFNYNNCQGKV